MLYDFKYKSTCTCDAKLSGLFSLHFSKIWSSGGPDRLSRRAQGELTVRWGTFLFFPFGLYLVSIWLCPEFFCRIFCRILIRCPFFLSWGIETGLQRGGIRGAFLMNQSPRNGSLTPCKSILSSSDTEHYYWIHVNNSYYVYWSTLTFKLLKLTFLFVLSIHYCIFALDKSTWQAPVNMNINMLPVRVCYQ